MKRPGLFALQIGLAVLAATTLFADVVTAPPLSGNFALSISGFELVTATTPSGSTSFHFDITGEGLLVADGKGGLTGTETFIAANPATPENGPVSAQCGGTLAGTVTEPGDGSAVVQLAFTPALSPTSPTGAQNACLPMAMMFGCTEVFPGGFYASPLAGASAASASVNLRKRRHRRLPNGGPQGGSPPSQGPSGGSAAPVVCLPNATCAPPVFLSGADRLKCVATAVTTTNSPPPSIDGALLSLTLQQTAPASIVVPTPVPEPSPLPTVVPNCGPGQAVCDASGACFDLTSDPNNCGACGNVCASGSCVAGQCQPASTPTCTAACNGVCTDLTSDPNNCGACGNACPLGQKCLSSVCVGPQPALSPPVKP
jgi:hypothetical protein